MATIHEREEGPRGCGYRKGGGTYLVSEGEMVPCGKLPLVLDVCPCCGAGIKPSRGWTWVNPQRLFKDVECAFAGDLEENPPMGCSGCPLDILPDTAGLLWIGEKFYSTPGKFSAEAAKMGVSRRLARVPRDFKVGETLVLLAHRKGTKVDGEDKPAIFSAFRPTAIEYIVKGTETDEELDKLEKRGFTLIKIKRIAPELPDLATRNSEARRGKTRKLNTMVKFINENMSEYGYRAKLVVRTKGDPCDPDINEDGTIPGLTIYKDDEAIFIFEKAPGARNIQVEEWLEQEIKRLSGPEISEFTSRVLQGLTPVDPSKN